MRIELRDENMPAKNEIAALAKNEKSVILTGAEPLKRTGIAAIVKALSNEEIIIETDGQALEKMAEPLKQAGLTGVNVVLNTLSYTRYKKTHQGSELEPVIEGVNRAIGQKLQVRLYVAIEKGFNEDEILNFVQLTFQHQLDIVFLKTMPYDEIKKKLRAMRPLEGEFGELELFQYPGSIGKIGFLK